MNHRPNPWETVQHYAELTRASNLPTCVSNTLVGCAIASGPESLPTWLVASIAAAVCLLYLGGVAINDVLDAPADRATHPARPIPSGKVSTHGAYTFAATVIPAGLAILLILGLPTLGTGLLLTALILAYNRYKSALLMGACRAMIYPVAGMAVLAQSPPISLSEPDTATALLQTLLLAGTLGLYVTGVTLIAKSENAPSPGAGRGLKHPQYNRIACNDQSDRSLTVAARGGHCRWIESALIPLLPALVLLPTWAIRPIDWTPTLVAGLGVTVWLGWATGFVFARPARTRQAVMACLSGICLVDAYFLTLLDRSTLSLAAVVCFVITAAAHRRIAGT